MSDKQLSKADALRVMREAKYAAKSSDDNGVPARMQGSKDCGSARDDVRPGATMQESRPAHPATASSEAKFDRVAYQREYMREYRKRKK
jgi:hypothetical protein